MKEFLYNLLNFVTFGKGLKRTINDHTLRLPTRYFKYFPADYEKDNFDFLFANCREGDIVLDIGAHIGLFAVIASQVTGKNGKVLAFEPAPSTFKILKKTIEINNAENHIDLFQKAVGREDGKALFFISDGAADNSNSMISYKDDRPLHGIDIAITTIDSVVSEKNLERVDFIKIDVEGAELDTLKGGSLTLQNLRPVCIVAIHPEPIRAKGDKLEDIYDLIISLKYTISMDNKNLERDKFLANTEMIDLHIRPV